MRIEYEDMQEKYMKVYQENIDIHDTLSGQSQMSRSDSHQSKDVSRDVSVVIHTLLFIKDGIYLFCIMG